MAGRWRTRASFPRSLARRKAMAGSLRAVLLLGVALLTLSAALTAAPTSVRAASDGTVATDVLNLRDGPGLDANVITQMYDGESVEVVDGPTDDGWYEVIYQGTDGWAFGGYLNVDGQLGWSDLSAVDGRGGGDSGAGPEHWIDVNRSSQTVSLMVGDEAIDSFWGAMGYDSSSDGFFSTAIGTYSVYSMNAALTWTDWGHVYITDWVGFDPDRSNGFHSYSKDANGNVLPNGDGNTGGCVALDDGAANELYNFAYIGMRVVVHW